MKPPSKAASAHDGCHLFKLAAETRNQIYELVFTIETNEDDSISLNEDTMVPSNALTGTCQQIYNESREMWRAAYHDYPTKRTFSIDVTDRKRPYIPELSREFFVRMSSFCVIWRADEYNDGNPLLLTAPFRGFPTRGVTGVIGKLMSTYTTRPGGLKIRGGMPTESPTAAPLTSSP